jgi:hypothetical protein
MRKRTIFGLLILGTLAVLVVKTLFEQRAERARMQFARQFVESVRTGGSFHEPYVSEEKRDDILESRSLMSAHYKLTRGPSSAGEHDYNLEFDNGACGGVYVWEGRSRSASLSVWKPPEVGCGFGAAQ